jgi:beta-phosphoglucomutase-like phosphatase (HAD superfamily)
LPGTGTLFDSVDLHALAWHEAMMKFGHDVTFDQARGQIGKGGDKFIPVFLSPAEQRDHGKELEEWRGKRFKSEYLPLVRPFSAVPDLLRPAVVKSVWQVDLELELADELTDALNWLDDHAREHVTRHERPPSSKPSTSVTVSVGMTTKQIRAPLRKQIGRALSNGIIGKNSLLYTTI